MIAVLGAGRMAPASHLYRRRRDHAGLHRRKHGRIREKDRREIRSRRITDIGTAMTEQTKSIRGASRGRSPHQRRIFIPTPFPAVRNTEYENVFAWYRTYEKNFALISSVGIFFPVQSSKEAAPWYRSMYMPLKVFRPASRAIFRSSVSFGS